MSLLSNVNEKAVGPALAMLPPRMSSKEARLQLLAIGLQESQLTFRDQVEAPGGKDLVDGPAMGLLQFERGGGVRGVMLHPASKKLAAEVCESLGVPFDERAIWKAMESNDVLAMVFGRLLLWTDPQPLPALDDAEGSWQCYLRNWRPGAVKRDYKGLHDKFLRNHAEARTVV